MAYQTYFLVLVALFSRLSLCMSNNALYNYNNIDPIECSVFCKYFVNLNGNLEELCTSSSSAGVNNFCLDCDDLLFRAVPVTGTTWFQCIPHLYKA